MMYEIKETEKVSHLFDGWQETLIWSCLQNIMGKVYVADNTKPRSAVAAIGCFAFFAGEPDPELIKGMADGFVIMVPQNEEWATLIEQCFPSAKRVIRYAIRKDTQFDTAALEQEIGRLPEGYELKAIDSAIYDKCLERRETIDFVSAFGSKERYLELGRGMVILKDGNIVSGASSFSRYDAGIEIEVNTIETERRKHLATIACAALILRCLKEGLYPSWDAQNMNSVRLAEKLGYEFDHEYVAYEVKGET